MKICVLTGAGISAESGIKTFRDAGGLWEGHDVMDVASPQGWESNQALVLNFYNERRRQLREVKPNVAHLAVVRLEDKHEVTIITQNVDDLHKRAGSTNVLHLHGELTKVRSTIDDSLIYSWNKDLNLGDLCEKGEQLRPHIVWFGEQVPMLSKAIEQIILADTIIIIGTSMQVYPAASLTSYAHKKTKIYYVDPKPQLNQELKNQRKNLTILQGTATIMVPRLVNQLLDT